MFEKEDETYCMTLRGLRFETANALYELKTLTGLPLYQLVDQIVTYYVLNHPSMLQQALEALGRSAEEYGGGASGTR